MIMTGEHTPHLKLNLATLPTLKHCVLDWLFIYLRLFFSLFHFNYLYSNKVFWAFWNRIFASFSIVSDRRAFMIRMLMTRIWLCVNNDYFQIKKGYPAGVYIIVLSVSSSYSCNPSFKAKNHQSDYNSHSIFFSSVCSLFGWFNFVLPYLLTFFRVVDFPLSIYYTLPMRTPFFLFPLLSIFP